MKKKLILSWVFAVLCIKSYAQDPDRIKITIKDTLKDFKDCVLHIHLSRKDKDSFLFPQKYYIGDITNFADLKIDIERKDSNNNYSFYRCHNSPISVPYFKTDPIKYKKVFEFVIIDSLEDLACITRGEYRIRILYNKRNADGWLDEENIIAKSKWVEFYVNSNKIYTRKVKRLNVNK